MAYRKTLMLPVSPNDLPAVQGWLQGLAVQGLHLEACDNGTFIFLKKEPVHRRYRIDPSKGNTMRIATPKLQDMYREFGWYYVDSYDKYHHVFYTDDPDAVEPFVSPEALTESLEQLKRKKLVFSILGLALWLLVTLALWMTSERTLFRKVLDILFFLSFAYAAYLDIKPLFKVKEQASDGSLLKNRYPHQTDRELSWSRSFAKVLIALLLLALLNLRLGH